MNTCELRTPARRSYPALLSLFLVLMAGFAPVTALSSPYYEDKTITMIMGLDPSAGGSTVGRLLATYLEQTLEGSPTIIVKHMPGASLMKAHQYVLLKAPRDGTAFYYGPRSSLGELLKLPGHNFKYSQFTVLGGVQISGLVVYARNDVLPGGLQRASDIVKARGLLFSGMAPEHGRMIISTLGLQLIGANYDYIAGYPSSGATRASVLSGETNITVDAAHAYLNQVAPQLAKNNGGRAIFSVPYYNDAGELASNDLLPGVKSLPELYQEITGGLPSRPTWDAIKTLIEIDQTMQHVFLGPPEMNPEAASEMRKAILRAFVSEAFRVEARRILGFVPEPVDYHRAGQILQSTDIVKPEVLELIKANIERNSRY